MKKNYLYKNFWCRKQEILKENQNLKEFILHSFAYIPMPAIWLFFIALSCKT